MDGWFFAFAVAAAPAGDVVVVGERKQAADPALGQLYVARYGSTGALRWEQTHASPDVDEGTATATAVAIDGAGHVIVAGSVATDVGSDFWILKLAP